MCRQLVPEFIQRIRVVTTTDAERTRALGLNVHQQGPLTFANKVIPGPCKILARDVSEVVGDKRDTPREPGSEVQLEFGVYHAPTQFLEAAKTAVHPFDEADHAPGAAREAIFRAITEGEEAVIRIQSEKLALWRRWRDELAEDERALHQQMPTRVAAVYRGKNFLLLKRILRSAGFCYCRVIDDIVAGCRITGDLGKSGIFHPRLREDGARLRARERHWCTA